MKVTELIVGDWVLDGTQIAQITSITFGGVIETTAYEFSNIEVIKPIPLTGEILERNGFEGTPTGDLFIEKKLWETYAIELFASEGSWIIRITDKTNWYIDGCNRINLYIKYIHELQHALKLCGIEKDIKL